MSAAQAIPRIREVIGERITTAMAVREHHGVDTSWHPPHPPEAVAYAPERCCRINLWHK